MVFQKLWSLICWNYLISLLKNQRTSIDWKSKSAYKRNEDIKLSLHQSQFDWSITSVQLLFIKFIKIRNIIALDAKFIPLPRNIIANHEKCVNYHMKKTYTYNTQVIWRELRITNQFLKIMMTSKDLLIVGVIMRFTTRFLSALKFENCSGSYFNFGWIISVFWGAPI